MEKFIATIKAYIMAAVTWLCRFEKDKILHFALADNIATVVWIGAALTIGWLLSLGWVTAICAVVTCAAILLKDCWLDPAPDWRDIWAGLIGLAWALAKIGLLWLCWRLFL